MTYRSYITALASLVLFLTDAGTAQIILSEGSFEPARAKSIAGSSMLNSNSVSDMLINGSTIWLGTGKGLSRSTDGGATWTHYFNSAEFGTEDVSAIAVHGNDVWVATAHTVVKDGNPLPEGSGLHYSADGGDTWRSFPQPLDKNNVDTLDYNAFSTIRALGAPSAVAVASVTTTPMTKQPSRFAQSVPKGKITACRCASRLSA